MVHPVGQGPVKWLALKGKGSGQMRDETGNRMKCEAPMREHPVITKGDSQTSGKAIQTHQQGNPRPTEMEKGGYRPDVHQHQENQSGPVDVRNTEPGRMKISGFKVGQWG